MSLKQNVSKSKKNKLSNLSWQLAVIGYLVLLLSTLTSYLLAWIWLIVPFALILAIISLIKEKSKIGLFAIGIFLISLPTLYFLPTLEWYGGWIKCGGSDPIEAFNLQNGFAVNYGLSNQFFTKDEDDYMPPSKLSRYSIMGHTQPDAYFCDKSAAEAAGYDNQKNFYGGHLYTKPVQ